MCSINALERIVVGASKHRNAVQRHNPMSTYFGRSPNEGSEAYFEKTMHDWSISRIAIVLFSAVLTGYYAFFASC